MTREEFQEATKLIQKREEKVYAWLRYLIGLASGALAVLVSLQGNVQSGLSDIAQKIAWVSLGAGILLGSLRLYGEVWISREMGKRFEEETERRDRTGDTKFLPLVVKLPRILKLSERLCYASLIVSVVSLVLYAITRH